MATDGEMQVDVPEATIEALNSKAFAAYRVVVTEGDDTWVLQRRWNDLRGMYDALQPALQALTPEDRASVPSFEAHSWRLWAPNLDPSFLAQRCETMQSLLRVLVKLFEVSVDRQVGPAPLLEYLARGGQPGTFATPIRARGPTVSDFTPTLIGDEAKVDES
eukprot:7038753-Prymnesium_polylepis.1